MKKYNPNRTPDPKEWNATDEADRHDMIQAYHKRSGIHVPNHRIHAAFHDIVENQVALGDEMNVARTLRRLMDEGLDRHNALHAIGFVLAEHMHRLMTDKIEKIDENEYAADLESLSAEKWRRMWQEED
jgi:hypothetical protein